MRGKTAIFFVFLMVAAMSLYGEIPAGYYDTAAGSGYTLKTQLHNIIDGHTSVSYTPGVWDAVNTIDVDNYYENDGTPLDMYSEDPAGADPYNWTFVTDQCGSYTGEGSCYNREHSFPKSWFNDATPMYTDMFHLYLTDGYVNGKRSSFPFGEVTSPSWTSQNGSKVGPCSYPGYTGTVFEPIDEFKGDFARTYFYMATRYEDVISGWPGSAQLNGTSDQCFSDWSVAMLTEWHNNDPVSQKEIDRNDYIYSNIQGNRNPFIDHPEWVYDIWGGTPPVPAVNYVTASQQVEESVGTLDIYISISQAVTEDVSVHFTVSGSAQEGADFSISQNIVLFPASSTADQYYTIQIIDDPDPENFEDIIMTIDSLETTDPDVVIGTNSQCVITINNSDGFDETPPEISARELINDSTLVLTFSEQVDPLTSQNISNYIVDNGVGSPATAVLGYLGDSTKVELSFPAAFSTGVSYTLTVNNIKDLKNNVIASNSTVNFGISVGGEGWIEYFEDGIGIDSQGYKTGSYEFDTGSWYLNNVYLESASNSYEGDHALRINEGTSTASLTSPSVNGIDSIIFYYRSVNSETSPSFSLQKSVHGGTFSDITTQTFGSTTYSQFAYKVNDTSDSIKIRILNDNQAGHLIIDNFEVVTFGSSNPTVTVDFTTISQSVEENAGSINIYASISEAAADDVTAYFTLSGTAAEGSDYSLSQDSLVFPASSTASQFFTLSITDDTDPEDIETVIMTLSSVSSADTDVVLGTEDQITVSINQNDGFDDVIPYITGHECINNSVLILSLSEAMDEFTTETLTNYVCDNGVGSPLHAVWSGDSLEVMLAFDSLTTGITYQLTINNIEDEFGNPIASNTTVDFSVPVSTGGGDGWIEDFENEVGITYLTYNPTSYEFATGVWESYQALVEPENENAEYEGIHAIRINDDRSGAHITTPVINGVDSIKFWYRSYNSGTESTFWLQKSVDGGAFENVVSQSFLSTTYSKFSFKVNDPSDNIKLRILNDNQDLHLNIDYVEIVQFPAGGTGVTADFISDVQTAETGTPVQFIDMSAADSLSVWEWDFDNDSVIDSYNRHPMHTYTQPGLYTVSLTVSDGDSTDTVTKTDYITITGTALSSPGNVSTSISGTDITITWDAVSGADQYDVYSSDLPYSGFAYESTVTSEQYTVSCTDAKKFYYIVAKTTAKDLKPGESHERFIDMKEFKK